MMNWWWRKKAKAFAGTARVLLALLLFAASGCSLVGGGSDIVTGDATVVAGATAQGKSSVAKTGAVTLTNDNWNLALDDADRYRGAVVDITGQIFNVLGDYDEATHYQLFTDPATNSGNTHLAVPPSLIKLQDGDVVRVVGTLDHMLVTSSRGGSDLRLPYVIATTIDVLSGPTFLLITPTAVPTDTPAAPTDTPVMPTDTQVPATPTAASVTTASATAGPATAAPATATSLAPMATPSHVNLEVPADSVSLLNGMGNTGDANAPNGHYYSSASSSRDWNGSGSLPGNAGALSFSFDAPKSGRYSVWIRMQYQNVDANSLWLRVDDKQAVLVGNEDGGYGEWRWVGWRDGNQGARIALDVSAGAHTFTIASREAGTRFDEVLITDDPSFQPLNPKPNGPAATAGPSQSTTTPTPVLPGPTATAIAVVPTATAPPPTLAASAAPTLPATSTPNPQPTAPARSTSTTQPTATAPATSTKAPTPSPQPTATAPATSTKAPTPSPQPTATAPATSTKAPTPPPQPTNTPQPTATLAKTATPAPSNTPQPTATMPNRTAGSYTVKPGDTLSDVAQQMYGDAGQFQRIYAANRDKLSSPDQIKPGQQLNIPR